MPSSAKPPGARSGASALLRALADPACAGIDVCFANPGTTEMHFVAALDELHPVRSASTMRGQPQLAGAGSELRRPPFGDAGAAHGRGADDCGDDGSRTIQPVLCLHENVATGAADGFARMARRPAIALLHLGPGLSNGLANAHNARRARSPLLMLVGTMATWHAGSEPPLQSDAAGAAATVSAAVVALSPEPRGCSGDIDGNGSGGGCGKGCKIGGTAAEGGKNEGSSATAAATAAGSPVVLLQPTPPQQPHGHLQGQPPLHQRGQHQLKDGNDGGARFRVTATPGGAPDGCVCTLLVPHDVAWDDASRVPAAEAARAAAAAMGFLLGGVGGDAANNGAGSSGSGDKEQGGGSPGVCGGVSTAGAIPAVIDRAGNVRADDGRALQDGANADRADVAMQAFVADIAVAVHAAMSAGRRVALYLGGAALVSEVALSAAGRISAKTGAALLCEGAFARAERGRGTPTNLERLPYFPQEAQSVLRRYALLICIDARPPVANFGYRDGPSELAEHLLHSCVDPNDDSSGGGRSGGGGSGGGSGGDGGSDADESLWCLDAAPEAYGRCGAARDVWYGSAMSELASALGAGVADVTPGVNCRGVLAPALAPPEPPRGSGALTADALCAAVAALQPPGCVVADESLTSGGSYWAASRGCGRFCHLTLTGGAIGCGPAVALGAAVATRRSQLVINLQADGSAAYTFQALWTQARVAAPIITLLCDNASYAILRVEAARQRLPPAGAATRELTSLDGPALDWVSLAHGMGVPAVCVETNDQLVTELRGAIVRCLAAIAAGGAQPPTAVTARASDGCPSMPVHLGGPFLIHARLC